MVINHDRVKYRSCLSWPSASWEQGVESSCNTLKFYGYAARLQRLKIWNASLAQWNLRRLISSHAKAVAAL